MATITTKVGSAGSPTRDYSTWATWEAAADSNCASGDTYIGEGLGNRENGDKIIRGVSHVSPYYKASCGGVKPSSLVFASIDPRSNFKKIIGKPYKFNVPITISKTRLFGS